MKRLSGCRAGMDVGMLFWVTPPPAFDPTSWFEPLADSSLRQTSDASLLLVGSGTFAALTLRQSAPPTSSPQSPRCSRHDDRYRRRADEAALPAFAADSIQLADERRDLELCELIHPAATRPARVEGRPMTRDDHPQATGFWCPAGSVALSRPRARGRRHNVERGPRRRAAGAGHRRRPSAWQAASGCARSSSECHDSRLPDQYFTKRSRPRGTRRSRPMYLGCTSPRALGGLLGGRRPIGAPRPLVVAACPRLARECAR